MIATVIKRMLKKRVVEITWRKTQGTLGAAKVLLVQSQGGTMLNTVCDMNARKSDAPSTLLLMKTRNST